MYCHACVWACCCEESCSWGPADALCLPLPLAGPLRTLLHRFHAPGFQEVVCCTWQSSGINATTLSCNHTAQNRTDSDRIHNHIFLVAREQRKRVKKPEWSCGEDYLRRQVCGWSQTHLLLGHSGCLLHALAFLTSKMEISASPLTDLAG